MRERDEMLRYFYVPAGRQAKVFAHMPYYKGVILYDSALWTAKKKNVKGLCMTWLVLNVWINGSSDKI